MCVVGVVVFVGGWWKSDEVFGPLMVAFIAIMGVFLAAFVGMIAFVVVGSVGLGLLNWILRRGQHDYQAFRRFKAALREFERAHGQWVLRRVWFWRARLVQFSNAESRASLPNRDGEPSSAAVLGTKG